MKNTVVHLRETYILPFIYYYLISFRKYHPVVVCRKIKNRDIFPFENIYLTPQKYYLENMINRATMKYFTVNKFFNNWYAYVEVIKKIKNVRMLHAHFGYEGYYALPVAKRLSLPLVVTFYGGDMSGLPRYKIWNRRFSLLFKQANAFLVEGKFMKGKMIELGCHEKKLHVVRIGVEVDKIKYLSEQLKKEIKIYIIEDRLMGWLEPFYYDEKLAY